MGHTNPNATKKSNGLDEALFPLASLGFEGEGMKDEGDPVLLDVGVEPTKNSTVEVISAR